MRDSARASLCYLSFKSLASSPRLPSDSILNRTVDMSPSTHRVFHKHRTRHIETFLFVDLTREHTERLCFFIPNFRRLSTSLRKISAIPARFLVYQRRCLLARFIIGLVRLSRTTAGGDRPETEPIPEPPRLGPAVRNFFLPKEKVRV